jgi:hypothetical protein
MVSAVSTTIRETERYVLVLALCRVGASRGALLLLSAVLYGVLLYCSTHASFQHQPRAPPPRPRVDGNKRWTPLDAVDNRAALTFISASLATQQLLLQAQASS